VLVFLCVDSQWCCEELWGPEEEHCWPAVTRIGSWQRSYSWHEKNGSIVHTLTGDSCDKSEITL
jgi:hypothetical protein